MQPKAYILKLKSYGIWNLVMVLFSHKEEIHIIAMGIFAFGALAMGLFSIGGLSIASYAAFGDVARGAIAIGKSEAHGTLFQATDMTGQNHSLVTRKLEELVPWYLSFFKNLFLMLLR